MRKHDEIDSAFSPTGCLDGLTSYFLVGIGGAGMSALARMLKHRGFQVSGTDSTKSPETDRLNNEGISVSIGHSGSSIGPNDAVVLTDAIDLAISPEYARARELGLPIVRRSQALSWLLRGKKVIAVTGTHGKTTTTGMLGNGLKEGGLEPLVVVGANIPQLKGPVWEGDGEFAVVEACEAYDSFHDLSPYIVLLTNLELDHVDFHGSYENLRSSVVRFVQKIPTEGFLVYCASDPGAVEVAGLVDCKKVSYILGDFGRLTEGLIDLAYREPLQRGDHNKLNAAGALTVADQIGGLNPGTAKGVIGFTGAERRQQVILAGCQPELLQIEDILRATDIAPVDTFIVIDDYAHHPTEVRESLKAIKAAYAPAGSGRRTIVVFQPHLYSRTQGLIKEFADALSIADEVVITDIYPAREDPIAGVSSARIAEKITKPIHYIPSRHLLPMKVAQMARQGDVIVGMGAGNISEFASSLVGELSRIYDLIASKAATGLSPVSRKVKVAVISGGDSPEREVSIHSGREIHKALTKLGYDSWIVDVTELLFKGANLGMFVGPDRPDIAFLAVHGTHAEDGAIQGLFELLHVPYTGSGVQASSIALDKALTKQILEQHGIRVPKGALLTEPEAPLNIHPPMIVKPNSQGSTVGLSFVEHRSQLCPALLSAFAYDDSVLVEEWITGMEISVPVVNEQVLLPVEIAPASGRYDFESKYTPGATIEVVPARLPEHILKQTQEIALKAHRALRCSGATRTDMIVRGDEIFVLEVNTLPGMTRTSLLPNSAQGMGISFEELCDMILKDGLARNAKEA